MAELSSRSDALIVFGKPPEAGEVKTRLTDVLSEGEAARLYRAFLADSLEAYARLGAAVRLYVTPPAAAFPDALVPPSVAVREQTGPDLGKRMQRAFAETFDAGYERAVIVGTDHPSLPPSHLVRAFEELTTEEVVVLGPSADGGYYLLGMRTLRPELFGGTYSHGEVFRQALDRIVETGAEPVVMPSWYDVDRAPELARLQKDLEAHPERAPRTREMLSDLTARYPRRLGAGASNEHRRRGDR